MGDGWIPQLAPNILSAPTNQSVNAGQNAAFAVTATGIPAPVFQWRRNGTNLAGATNTSLTISNAQPADTGIFSVVVSNSTAALTNFATLVVSPLAKPQIATVNFRSGQIQSAVNCAAGLTYTVLASSNLVNWQPLLVTNPVTAAFNWTDFQAGNFPARSYRVQAAPPP